MVNIISIANQKGGVGKTTTSVNLSSALAKLNKKVLLIDIDPQGNATMGSGIDKHNTLHTICEVLLGESDIKSAIYKTEYNFDVLSSNTNLVAAEVNLINLENKETVLKSILNEIKDNYDYIIIDCPPSLNMLTINAFVASNSVIIPMQCEYYALEGLSSLIMTIEKIKEQSNPQLKIMGLLRTMYDGRNNLSNEVSLQLLEHFPKQVFKTVISRNVKLAEAPSFGVPVIEYAKSSKGSIAYISLATEVIKRTKKLS
ncbi:Chromosome (plasmid) partitioning protein ParA [hydrothermal vent metagenome]|uniref:Chromosome (Plasmid) partitioning protein ParA n=1 Tax=hydrothermal vent metagenome TaxID=652676 RepID=A0A1W1BST8_9ZZZZ